MSEVNTIRAYCQPPAPRFELNPNLDYTTFRIPSIIEGYVTLPYHFSSEEISQARDFAALRTGRKDGAHYAVRSSQTNFDKILGDITVGALGEIATSRVLQTSLPDFGYLTPDKKNFSADLTKNGYDLHVKSQSLEQAERFSTSWMCQSQDRLVTDPSPNEIIIGCVVNPASNMAYLTLKVSALDAIWGTPKSPKLRDKVALYLKQNAG